MNFLQTLAITKYDLTNNLDDIHNKISIHIYEDRKIIHELFHIHPKKDLIVSKHSQTRWDERVMTENMLRSLASQFKLILIKRVIVTGHILIYVSHKNIAYIVEKNKIDEKSILLTILTKQDVENNPNKLWWFF